VISRLVDIAFLFEPPFIEELIIEKVATVPLQLVSTEKNQTLTTIKNMVMVDYGESVNSQIMRDFSEMNIIRHQMSQPKIALNFILEASGCAYLPKQMSFEYLNQEKLYPVEMSPNYSRDIFAIYLAKSHKKELIKDALMLFPYIQTL
jgi:hypothetical protein